MRDQGWGVGRRRSVAAACALALALAATACGRSVSDDSPGKGGGRGGGGAQAAGGASAAGDSGGADANAGGANPDAGSGGTTASLDWVPDPLRRLTAFEYESTVTDVLGTSFRPQLAEFSKQVDGFDNNAAANDVSDVLYRRYLVTAEALADEVFASATLRPRVVTCAQTDDAGCVRQVTSQIGLRLFRRPLLEEELASYQRVYARARGRGQVHDGSLKDVLIALLASAEFLYRMEFEPQGPGKAGQYDLATRLSYLL